MAGKLFGVKAKARCVVLYYHSVTDSHRKSFLRQMEILKRVTIPVPADYQGELQPGTRYSAITFDDGFLSVLQNAVPELINLKIPFTVFVPAGNLGKRPQWIGDNPLHPFYSEKVIDETQLHKLSTVPGATIGSHGMSHRPLGKLDYKAGDHEIIESKNILEKITGKSISLLSFPHGRYSLQHLEIARKSGYKRVYTIKPTFAFLSQDEFLTGRFSVDADEWIVEYRLKIAGAYRWMAIVSTLKRILKRKNAL
jgi:peptidoglycan/xylan/chitin deacetylase (PgdA/CDA1 family)